MGKRSYSQGKRWGGSKNIDPVEDLDCSSQNTTMCESLDEANVNGIFSDIRKT